VGGGRLRGAAGGLRRHRGAGVILRGIRAISDYEYELQMALMNRKLEPRLETVFMLPGEAYSYPERQDVRELAQLGGPLTGLVPGVSRAAAARKSLLIRGVPIVGMVVRYDPGLRVT